ncbi:MAG TPA: phosphoribosylamine--glycine ligase, partial [Gemmatimonadota bacterium]|nr:phosphoribosylamine--glycine ligase [Gemmatimonadota bacterium]
MKFLFYSYDALITDIAWQVVKEGHEVRYWIREKKAKSVGEGFVPMSKDWKADAEWADVVVFDDVLGMGEDADRLRRAGKAVVGGSPYTDRLEDDRGFGQTELKAFGINIIPFEEF